MACGHCVSVSPDHGENHPQTAHEIETHAATTRQEIAPSTCDERGARKIREEACGQTSAGARDKKIDQGDQGDQALDACRGPRGVQPLSHSQTVAEGRVGTSQSLYPPG